MRLAVMSIPSFRIGAVVLLLFVLVALASPTVGTLPVFAALLLAGCGALATWWVLERPVAMLIGAYALLAPADALLIIGGGGATLTRFVSFLAIFGLSVALIADRAPRALPRVAVAWFVVLVWMIASVLWATNQSMAIQKVEQIGLAVLVFELVALVRSTRIDLRVIIAANVVTSAIIAAYAIVVHPVEARLGADRVVLKTATGRADPNDLAAGLILAFALCIAAATSNERGWWRIAGAALSVLLFVAILATGSRGGLMAALLVVLWIAIRARRRIVAGLFVLGAAAISVMQGDVWARFVGDDTGAGRSDIWKVGVAAFREHWFAGSGIGTFPDVYNSVYLSVPHHFYINWSRPAHDLLVQSFTELGIVGGILVLTAFWFQFRQLSSIGRKDPDLWLRVGLEAATLGYFVAALFIDVLDIKQTWMIPILTVLVANIRSQEGAGRLAPAPAPTPAPAPAPAPALSG
ncbi:MAG: O-antigen ligase family protein [Candidatus Lustribacter sp.]|jgi:O-antigen ligase